MAAGAPRSVWRPTAAPRGDRDGRIPRRHPDRPCATLPGQRCGRDISAPNARSPVLEMLQKTLVETIGLEVSRSVEPPPITGDPVGRIEAQAGEEVRRDL